MLRERLQPQPGCTPRGKQPLPAPARVMCAAGGGRAGERKRASGRAGADVLHCTIHGVECAARPGVHWATCVARRRRRRRRRRRIDRRAIGVRVCAPADAGRRARTLERPSSCVCVCASAADEASELGRRLAGPRRQNRSRQKGRGIDAPKAKKMPKNEITRRVHARVLKAKAERVCGGRARMGVRWRGVCFR
jgi:hypothetical protein